MGIEAVLDKSLEGLKEDRVQGILKDSCSAILCDTNGARNHAQAVVSKLSNNLYLCSASYVTPALLDQLNIKCIVNVAPELPDIPLHRNDIIYHKIGILDNATSKISARFEEAVDLINRVGQQGGSTLVYCVAGVSRSATICLAYFMRHENLSLLEAYNHVKKRRPRIRPNCNFFRQLIEYERTLRGSNTVEMLFNEMVKMEIPEVYDCEYRFITRRRRNLNNRRY